MARAVAGAVCPRCLLALPCAAGMWFAGCAGLPKEKPLSRSKGGCVGFAALAETKFSASKGFLGNGHSDTCSWAQIFLKHLSSFSLPRQPQWS